MAFKPVGKLADLPEDSGICVQIEGIDVGLFRIGRGNEIHAMDNRCPHAGYPLHLGRLDGSVIICPLHGWPFDVCTGRMPGNEDGFAIDRYPIRIDGDDILIDFENPIVEERAR